MREILIELRRLLALAFPIVVTQLGNMLLGVVDTAMLGRVGREALDAAALGNIWAMGTMAIGMGVVLGIDPLVAQAQGAGDGRALGLLLQRGVVLALLISVPVMLLWTLTGPGLEMFGQSPHLAADAHAYVLAQLPGAPAFLVFIALRSYLQARGITGPALVIVLAANLLNFVGDWALIYGELGMPALGVVGAGIATGVVRVFMAAGLAWLIGHHGLHRGAWVPWSRAAFDRAELLAIAGIGIGVGFQLGLEMWAFQAAMLLAGWLGEAELAAYTVVINVASVSFMIPLGISMAAVVRVGNLVGAGRPREAQRAAWVALALGAGVMGAAALVFVLGRESIPALYGVDPGVQALATATLPVAAAFQVFDGTQVVGCGVLRGMGQTRPAAWMNLVGYYALALPLAYWLAFERGQGVAGLWWGLTVGLLAVAAALVCWIAVRGPAAVVYRRQ